MLLFDGEETKSSVLLNDAAIELKRDFRGNAHVICKEHVYGVYSDGDQIEIGQIPKDYYFKYIEPIVDTNTSKIFFSDFSKIYPAFDYYVYDKLDSSYKSIVNIKDDLMMELYRSEYKWMDVRTKLWAKNKELETGIDAEIYIERITLRNRFITRKSMRRCFIETIPFLFLTIQRMSCWFTPLTEI